MNILHIDIVSDIVCPWCVIGYKNLAKAIKILKGELKFTINWKPFQLHPEIPIEGFDKHKYMDIKFKSSERRKSSLDQICEIGEKVGFNFNFSRNRHLPNTFLAHRLLWFSESMGLQNKISEALFYNYFTEGKDVGSIDELISISEKNGLEKDTIETFLRSDLGAKEVIREEKRSREMKISSVPTYIFNKKYMLVGGQEPDTFVAYLRKIKEKETEKA